MCTIPLDCLMIGVDSCVRTTPGLAAPDFPRSLYPGLQIDMMVLYTTAAMVETDFADGPMRTEAQMETEIITAYEGTNNALRDSDVDITLNIVYIGRVGAFTLERQQSDSQGCLFYV